jgi:hypothetical protein
MTFGEYVASDLCLDNSQVRVLSGCPELGPQWNGSRPLCAAAVTSEHLAAAQRNIERYFLAAAPVDDFTDLLVLLSLIFDWPPKNIQFVRKNVTKARPLLSQIPFDVRRLIDDKFLLDRKLYEWVTDRFRRQARHLGSPFALKRAAFERLSARSARWTHRLGDLVAGILN